MEFQVVHVAAQGGKTQLPVAQVWPELRDFLPQCAVQEGQRSPDAGDAQGTLG